MLNPDSLIQACQKGERKAQQKLYEQFAPKLFAVCIHYSNSKMEAEDYLHEGFIKIFENIWQYKHKGSFEGWMRRVMVNTILEGYRKSKKMIFVDETKIPSEDYEESQENEESNPEIEIQEIMKLAEELPARYKLVFNLYVIEEYTHEQIATQLGISIGTSKSNLARARQWIKSRLTEKKTDKVKEEWQR